MGDPIGLAPPIWRFARGSISMELQGCCRNLKDVGHRADRPPARTRKCLRRGRRLGKASSLVDMRPRRRQVLPSDAAQRSNADCRLARALMTDAQMQPMTTTETLKETPKGNAPG